MFLIVLFYFNIAVNFLAEFPQLNKQDQKNGKFILTRLKNRDLISIYYTHTTTTFIREKRIKYLLFKFILSYDLTTLW